jgi:hypothetical protein
MVLGYGVGLRRWATLLAMVLAMVLATLLATLLATASGKLRAKAAETATGKHNALAVSVGKLTTATWLGDVKVRGLVYGDGEDSPVVHVKGNVNKQKKKKKKKT